jgi:hypothetical protein
VHFSFDDCETGIMGVLNRPYYFQEGMGDLHEEIAGTKSGVVGCVTGKVGTAVEFDNVENNTGEIIVSAHPAIDLEADGTVSVWVRSDAVQDAAAFGRWFVQDSFGLLINEQNVWTFDAAFWPGGQWVDTKVRSNPVTTGEWVHIVAVARRNDELTLYQNGVRVGWKPLPHDFVFQQTHKELLIGRFHQGSGPYFKGAVDELKIWKTALTKAEVAELHCSD